MGKRRGYVERINELLQPGESAGLMVLDLFAGCGGLSLGFEAAGFSTMQGLGARYVMGFCSAGCSKMQHEGTMDKALHPRL